MNVYVDNLKRPLAFPIPISLASSESVPCPMRGVDWFNYDDGLNRPPSTVYDALCPPCLHRVRVAKSLNASGRTLGKNRLLESSMAPECTEWTIDVEFRSSRSLK